MTDPLEATLDQVMHDVGYLVRKKCRNGIADLLVLFGPRTAEIVIVRKRLEARGLSHG
jgi:hypothetical protein